MVVDIDKRTFNLGVSIVQLVNLLPKNVSGYAIGNQIIRSGTSVGANVQEALGGHSKTEFIYCMNIAKKEARETRYWLQLITSSQLLKGELIDKLLKEIDELVAILTTIVKNAKLNKNL